jgi:ABC-type transport system involved in cytochrome c biogenesis permease subunit
MRKKLYDDRQSWTDAEIKSARKSVVVLGLSFIAAGSWGLWSDLQFEKARGVLNLFLSFLEPSNRAPALYYSCIALGVIFLFISRMRPYGKSREET